MLPLMNFEKWKAKAKVSSDQILIYTFVRLEAAAHLSFQTWRCHAEKCAKKYHRWRFHGKMWNFWREEEEGQVAESSKALLLSEIPV